MACSVCNKYGCVGGCSGPSISRTNNFTNNSIGRDGESAYEEYVRAGGEKTFQEWALTNDNVVIRVDGKDLIDVKEIEKLSLLPNRNELDQEIAESIEISKQKIKSVPAGPLPAQGDESVYMSLRGPGTWTFNGSTIVTLLTNEIADVWWNGQTKVWSLNGNKQTLPEAEYPVEIETGPEPVDLQICDELGFPLQEFVGGHIRTKNFDSKESPKIQDTSKSVDLTFEDIDGYELVRFSKGHIETKNFDSSQIGKSRRSLKILSIGNSYSEDELSYSPFIIDSMNRGVDLEMGIMYLGGASLQDHWNNIQSGSLSYLMRTRLPGAPSWDGPLTGRNIESVVKSQEWDIIIFQQASINSIDYGSVQPYLNNIINRLSEWVLKPVKFGWLLTHAYAPNYNVLNDWGITTDRMHELIVETSKRVLKETIVDFLIPSGTAVQNARKTPLNQYGDFGSLTPDGTHLQEGIPCLVAGYCSALTLLSLVDLGGGVSGDENVPTQAWIVAKNIPNQNGSSVGATQENAYIAQKCAIMAIKNPYVITDVNNL